MIDDCEAATVSDACKTCVMIHNPPASPRKNRGFRSVALESIRFKKFPIEKTDAGNVTLTARN